jgi:hypothetical protein
LNFTSKSSTSTNRLQLIDKNCSVSSTRKISTTFAGTAEMSTEEDRRAKAREAGDREAARLWRAWRTAHEMVQDRGYQLSDEEVQISLEEFRNNFTSPDGSIEYAPKTELQRPSY